MGNKMTWGIPAIICATAFTAVACGSAEDIGGNENVGVIQQADHTCPPPDPIPGPGASEVAARLHSCTKMPYKTVGRVLADFGLSTNMGATDANGLPRAYNMWSNSKNAFGVPLFDGRIHEKQFHSTASALKLFDIFVQAAPELMTTIPSAAHCEINGVSVGPIFDATTGDCNADAISCLIGYPATADHTLLCNLVLDQADPANAVDVNKKQRIAIATLLAAAHTCE